ncbi:MAG: DUF932 domain-containing protein [Phycisphaerales bacterium]|nr:DUF932 domain-containing protein [Phycisphaerales bacterium]
MSHEIDTSTGRAAVFVTGTPAWHNLGRTIEHAATSAGAINLAGLNWHVAQWPINATDPVSWHTTSAPDHVANVRTDTRAILGIVGKGYHVFQNVEAFDFMDSLVGDKLAMFETAGSLKGGRKVWMLARIPKEYRAGPDDLIKPYVLLVNSHDGTSSLRMLPTTVRVVCQNTLNLALRNAGSDGIAIRHRPNLAGRVKEAREKLGIIAARFDQFDEELHAMLATQMTGRRVKRYFDTLLPAATTDREKINRLQTLTLFNANFENPRNNLPGIRGTAWAAYNAVSEWADHQRTFRGKDDVSRAENRLASVWFGSSNAIKQRAYAQAMELADTN